MSAEVQQQFQMRKSTVADILRNRLTQRHDAFARNWRALLRLSNESLQGDYDGQDRAMDDALEEVSFSKYGHLSDEDLLEVIEATLSDIMARSPLDFMLRSPEASPGGTDSDDSDEGDDEYIPGEAQSNAGESSGSTSSSGSNSDSSSGSGSGSSSSVGAGEGAGGGI